MRATLTSSRRKSLPKRSLAAGVLRISMPSYTAACSASLPRPACLSSSTSSPYTKHRELWNLNVIVKHCCHYGNQQVTIVTMEPMGSLLQSSTRLVPMYQCTHKVYHLISALLSAWLRMWSCNVQALSMTNQRPLPKQQVDADFQRILSW